MTKARALAVIEEAMAEAMTGLRASLEKALTERERPAWTGPGSGAVDELRKSAGPDDVFKALAPMRPSRIVVPGGEGCERGRRENFDFDKLAAEGRSAVDDLKKLHAAAAHRTTAALATQSSGPVRAIVDAFDEADRLRDLRKATPAYLPAARVREADEAAAFLVAMGKVQPTAMRKGDVPSALTPPTAEEVAAVDNAAWAERLTGRAVAAEIRRVRPRRIP